MNNQDTAAEIRRWVADANSGHYSWPTDGCGYEQHMAFVTHRNRNWRGEGQRDFDLFCLAYANALEQKVAS